MNKNIIIIPTYNEIDNVSLIINSVFELYNDIDILIVDDSSPDGTADVVKNLQHEFENRLYLLVRKEKSGLGTAYISGFRWALKRDYEYIIEMDADFSHNPEHVKKLLQEAYRGADMVVGSRYVKNGEIKDWPIDRRVLSYGGSIYARMITGLKVKDPTGGFVCFRRKTLEDIDLQKISSVGYSFQIEMKYAAHIMGKKIVEVPITFVDRIRGESKMNGSIIKEAALGVIRMRLQEKSYYEYKASEV